jgi:heme A synthase
MKLSLCLNALVAIQLSAGAANLLLLAPIWMQLVHLMLSNFMWIILVLLGVTVLPQPSTSTAGQRAVTRNTEMLNTRARRRDKTQPWKP